VGKKLILLALALMVSFETASAASADDFYKGKTIRIVVGFSAGGGFDTYARAIARHMSKHIPGQPAIVVENMTGAGSLIAANHVYKVAKPDGLTIGHFIGGLFLGQVLGQKGIEFDARKFEYLGAPITDHVVCAMTKASGITSVENWMASKTPVKMGGIAPGTSTPDNATRILKAAVGLPIQLVTGYKGTAEVRLAAESGEVAGGCWGWDSVSWHPRRQRLLAPNPTPGNPEGSGSVVAQSFWDTLKDPEFLADANKSKLNVDPVPADVIEKDISALFKLDPSMVGKLKDILYN
jgi:tripartite-type tricarboxylate transporter receptor subunit TctC